MNMRLLGYAVLCAGVLVLSGCGSLFGGKGMPDENRVIAGPKLAVPPEFELRPPREGDDFATKVSAEKSGEIQTLIGGGPAAPAAAAPTDTDTWLLETVGGTKATTVTQTASGTVVTTTATPTTTVVSGTTE